MINKNKIYFIIIFTGLILAAYQTLRVDSANYDLKFKRHTAIIENTIEYPYKYRLLNPFISSIWFSGFKLFLSENASFIAAYFIQNILVFCFMLFCLFRFFSLWFEETGAIISLLLFAVLVPVSLTGYDTLGDMTTAGVMALGFYYIVQDKLKYLFPLIFIAALNELQAVLLIMFYFFSKSSNFANKKVWLNSILLTITFVTAYAAIYLIRGGQASGGDVEWYFTKDAAFNIANKSWIFLWVLMIAPLLYFAAKDFSSNRNF